jgi:hypothetical protein
MALTPRGRALRWLRNHRGLTEQPAGSNTDNRKDGIRAAQIRCAGGGTWLVRAPWCGTWTWNALHAAGVKRLTSRLASVALIEDDARAHRGCFRGWRINPADKDILRGDLVVLFGRGVHVEVIRSVNRRRRYYVTDGGNTSAGVSGSQSNGGTSARRIRPFSQIHGVALVDYPNR